MDHLKITASVYSGIINTLGRQAAESGGVFAVDSTRQTIVDFYYDADAGCSTHYYRPTCAKIEAVVDAWSANEGIFFGGFVHSHPSHYTGLSAMDIICAEKIIEANNLPYIYMGVVCNELYIYKITPVPDQGDPLLTTCTYEIIF